jgi:hypothetical protein
MTSAIDTAAIHQYETFTASDGFPAVRLRSRHAIATAALTAIDPRLTQLSVEAIRAALDIAQAAAQWDAQKPRAEWTEWVKWSDLENARIQLLRTLAAFTPETLDEIRRLAPS